MYGLCLHKRQLVVLARYPDLLAADGKGVVWEHEEASSNHFLLSQQASLFPAKFAQPFAIIASSQTIIQWLVGRRLLLRRRHDMTWRMIMGELGLAMEKQPIGWAAGYTGIMKEIS